jgi:predicted ATP-grasp superfamily ATP-dependent carboligase
MKARVATILFRGLAAEPELVHILGDIPAWRRLRGPLVHGGRVLERLAPLRDGGPPAARADGDSRPFSVLILDGESPYALRVAQCLVTQRPAQIHVLSKSARTPLRFSRLVESFQTWNGVANPSAVESCSAHARRLGVDLYLGTAEAAVGFLARERKHLALPCVPVPAVDNLQTSLDKWKLAEFLRARALTHPPTVLCISGEASREEMSALRFPVLMKPRMGGNGFGIRRFQDAAALERHLGASSGLYGEFIAQTEIRGRDIDCSVLCRDGEVLAYTIQQGFTPSAAFKSPGGVEFTHDPAVIHIVRKLMAALRWSGVAHIDLRYDLDSGAVNIIEINPRFWGSVLASLHAGVNFPHLACLAALGVTFDEPDFRSCRYVAGSTALSYWKRGKFGKSAAGFSFTDTVFWYSRWDPLPTLVEPFLQRL